tara:strand:- start:1718 stop:3253 length:1536 start_codon:yes stop_codon:yes gene_type:complete
MNSLKKIRILSRKSDLAVIQAKSVGDKLLENFSDIEIEYIEKKTFGDLNLKTPLSEMGSAGVFTDDLRNDLIKNKCDMAVHSWKDLPLDLGPDTVLAGTLSREDQRDILFVKKNKIKQIKKDRIIKIYSSAPRRVYNLESFIKDFLPLNCETVKFENIRGNIITRFNKFLDNEVDGFVVAKAAIDRFINNHLPEYNHITELVKENINKCLWVVTPLSQNPTSPGQGALGIEVNKKNINLIERIKKISDPLTFHCVAEERKMLEKYGGGCHQKIGISCFPTFFGLMKSEKGELDNGKKFYSWSSNQKKISFNKNITEEILYPNNLKNYNIFEREEISKSIESINKIEKHCIWISRKSALPISSNISSNNIIWTSGIKTWKALIEREIWVNGTSDGMGEDFNPNISTLSTFPWIKFTHNLAPKTTIRNILTTYKLKEMPINENLNNKRFFYWMSSTAFNYALRLNPQIINANHACGPGNTYTEIKKMIKDPKNLQIVLSYSEWKNNLLSIKEE